MNRNKLKILEGSYNGLYNDFRFFAGRLKIKKGKTQKGFPQMKFIKIMKLIF